MSGIQVACSITARSAYGWSFCNESSSENSFCVIETRALRRSSVSRLGDGRTIRQRSRQAFCRWQNICHYQQVNHRICNFAASDLDCCLLALSYLRLPQQTTKRRRGVTISRACVRFFCLQDYRPGSVITDVIRLTNENTCAKPK